MARQHIQLNDIALFVEVARRKSFSLAARALSMPTSTLSRHISQLEELIGIKLINRNTRRLELTDAGTEYLKRCQGLIDEARIAHEPIQALSESPKGKLTVALPYSIAIWLLPEAVKAFTDQYPDLECEFDLSLRATEQSDGTPFDLVLSFGSDAPNAQATVRDGYILEEITALNLQLYASDAYLREHGEPTQPADLVNHECFRTAIDAKHSLWMLHNGTRTEHVTIRGSVAGNNISVIGTLGGLGMGIIRLPDCRALAPIIQSNSLKRILPEWTLAPISIYAETPSAALPAKTRLFMDFLRPWLNPIASNA